MSLLGLGAPSASASSKPAPFDPLSVSYVSPQDGWVLGTLACAHHRRCLTLLYTVNGGLSWIEGSLNSTMVKEADTSVNGESPLEYGTGLGVRFANVDDGWIFGTLPVKVHDKKKTSEVFELALWSTHNGGATWSSETLKGVSPRGTIYDVEASSSTVYALLAATNDYDAVVYSSGVGTNQWHKDIAPAQHGPAGGAQPGGAIVLKGSSGWLIYGNDRGTTGSARLSSKGTWVAWRAPCTSVGYGYAVPAAASVMELAAVCGMGGFASPMPKTAPKGAVIGSSWLYLSKNGGASFTPGPELRPVKENLSFGQYSGVLASPEPGVFILSRNVAKGAELIASFNDGRTWSVVSKGDITWFTDIDFAGPNRGVAIGQLANHANQMLTTPDGGRRWTPVNF
jgi:hypothetical protein